MIMRTLSFLFTILFFLAGTSQAAELSAGVSREEIPLAASRLVVGSGFSPIVSWDLNQYKKTIDRISGNVSLDAVTHEGSENQVLLAFDSAEFSYLFKATGTLTQEGGAQVWTYDDNKVHIVRKISGTPRQAYARMTWDIQFKDKAPKNAYISVQMSGGKSEPDYIDHQLAYLNKEVTRHRANDFGKKENLAGTKLIGPVKWIGALSRYFLLAVVADGAGANEGYFQTTSENSGFASLTFPVKDGSVSIATKAYFGPKEVELLRSIDASLDVAVDFGWLTFLAYPMLRLLRLIFGFFHNYGVSIILLTLFIKVVTFPLNFKAAQGTQKMAKLQPHMAKLKEKYKDDMPAYNREVMALMKQSGANPMAGCLPVLIQMPVFFALYRVLNYSVELYQSPFAFWIHDLSAKDAFYVTPLLLTGLMFLQQRLTPSPASIDPMQKKMFQFLPIIFGVTMIALPAGLTLYMLTNSVASILQQVFLNKKLGIGNVNATAAQA